MTWLEMAAMIIVVSGLVVLLFWILMALVYLILLVVERVLVSRLSPGDRARHEASKALRNLARDIGSE